MEPRELEDLLYLQARIMSDYRDPRRGSYRYGYLFAETVDNADSAFYRAIQLVDAGEVDWLVVPEGHLGHGYAGYDASVARLKALGFKGQVPILKINVDAAINTRNEMDAFVSYQMAYRIGDIALIAPPFHMPRAFMTAITVFERAGLQSRAYAVPGIPLPWSDEVAHSQGTLRRTRFGLLDAELDRIKAYQQEKFGSLFTPEQVIKYLEWRDGNVDVSCERSRVA